MKCKKCNGLGLIKKKGIPCNCKNVCIKCENNERMIEKTYIECVDCIGTGDTDDVNKVLCFIKYSK